MELGSHEFEHGNFGKAYVVFERCLEVVGHGRPDDLAERRARARSRMAIALKKLGKLTMTESELRSILRDRAMISPQTQIRTLLQLASVNRERGDRYLAGIIAHECLDLARQENDRPSEAAACQILGNVRFEEGDPDSAVREFETALEIWKSLGHRQKKITALATLGDCYSARGEHDPGWTALREALSLARELSDRRGIAYALHKMGVVCLREDRVPEGQDYIARSNLEADRGPERYFDILFANTYHLWEQARHNGNGTQAKIAFGRLKHLRPEIERRMPEREKFDQYLRRSQEHAD
jgi:tetratricopeptide (TPR) repeat protein